MIQRDDHGWHILELSPNMESYDRVATVYDNRDRAMLYDSASSLRSACVMAESNADFHEDGTVTIPLWVMDRIRSALGR